MFDALKKLVDMAGSGLPDENAVAVGLLLEVIRMDDDFDTAERAAVTRIISRRSGAMPAEAAKIISEAEGLPRTTYDDNALLKRVNDSYTAAQKTKLVEILWEIALADGELHRFENHAILVIANQLGMGQAQLDATKSAARVHLAD